MRQISSLMYPKIQQRQVIMNVHHTSCVRPPQWSLLQFLQNCTVDTSLCTCCVLRDFSETLGCAFFVVVVVINA